MYRLLIAEDEPVISQGIINMLDWNALGFQIIGVAEDGLIAQWLVELYRPDAVLTDIRMPQKDGMALLQFIKQRYPKTEVVLLTAYAHFEYAREAVNNGAFKYVLKDDMDVEMEPVFQELARHFERAQPVLPLNVAPAMDGEHLLFAARDFIDMHYTEDLNLQDIANRFHFNASYFSRAFKQAIGLGFLEYIRRRRMLLARYLLVTTTLPLSEIAQRVGYGDLKHFSELFRREFGLKPAAMRKRDM